jgi:hypothetical protein
MLVEAEDVAAGIAEACGDFGGVGADGLGDFASVGGDRGDSGGHVVNHNVNHEAGSCGWRAIQCPDAADFADAVVEGDGPVTARANFPAKNFFVEGGGATGVGGRDFDVADFSVAESWRHGVPLRERKILTGADDGTKR